MRLSVYGRERALRDGGLRMQTRQHEHRNEHQCRSSQGKVRCFRYGIRENMVFGHDGPPAKSLKNQRADETWG